MKCSYGKGFEGNAMIAVSITAQNADKAIADIKEANEKADLIELRLDFLQEVNETILKELLEVCKKPVIVTYRNKNYGASVETTERMFMLLKAIEFNAHFVDIDFNADKKFVKEMAANKGSASMILSYHNFDETPALHELTKILKSMLLAKGADIIKIVTYAKSEQDNDTVLALIKVAKTLGKPIIAFCMGPKGKKSRIDSIKMGGFLTYAALRKGKEAAPGQPTVEEMREAVAE